MNERQRAIIERAKQRAAIIQRAMGGGAANPMRSRIEAATSGQLQASPQSLEAAARADQIAMDRLAIEGVGGAAGGAVIKAAQGLPFIGEYTDEMADKIQLGAGQRMRDARGAMDRERPKTALAAEVTGGVVGSLPLVGGAVGAAAKAPGMVGKVAAGIGFGVAGAGTEGAISGYGAGTDAESRRGEALQRGATGAVVGGVLGALAPIVGAGAKSVYRRVKKLDVSLIADEFGVDRRTAAVIKRHLVNDDLDAAQARLAQIGDGAMLADAGPGTSQALDTAAQMGGKALRTARDRVSTRTQEASQKMTAGLDRVLGTAKGVNTSARDIASRTSKTRQKAYERAYSAPIDYSEQAGRNIEATLERIPPKTLKSAVDEANEAMQAAGARNQQIMAEISDDGSVVFREMPNVQQLDEIKKALGDKARSEVDAFGRMTAAGIRANRLAGDLKAAVAEAVPNYGRAVKLGGDKIAEDQALDVGRRLLSAKTSVEDVAQTMRGASQEARIAAKQGLRENIENTLSNVRRTVSDPDVDSREAMQLVKDLSSRANRKKLQYVLGQNGSKALLRELEQAEAALALRAAISSNSATAIRTAGRESLQAATEPGAVRTLAEGRPVEAGQKIIQALTGATGEARIEMTERIAAQIADALTGIRGKDAERALRLARQAMSGQPIKDAEAQFVVRALGEPALAAIYQSMQQPLER